MTLCSQSNGFDYLDPNLCTLESLFGRIRNWMRRAGNKLVYNLYIIEAKYRFFYEQQEFTIHLIHLPGLHESPMVFPDC